ncbi:MULTISPECIES: gluconeogenesis factor YvcK family protein [Aerococcus]|uniref:Putative gluconeogenesis factor n=2 Tax=Lactobacillales TaxID=186826 RepID=A0A5N1BPJ9_9LACT|nr:uridine diphosphate-N-acetylglucosamine-binding protein YvcK [Aerococcus urinae]KAA9242027.1 uridine diphosphate-N-acetylglucosamine-binding protein YvcK [Aerococcus urinae]MDK7303079.1 uridine diphosphate-N-acetylglucosamine-binding protein YvcK [Aerococcus urinae]MDK7801361.1 uridine diphosphate-N-acetylglucosamine-binding protein YvcK [Aerococcus urinae]MDK8655099.1 uridine diphosphate-N-acetylglucosamine-binding protein YvcK [Aerococcus urinae]RAV70889.1 hypothetical protein DBT40_06725
MSESRNYYPKITVIGGGTGLPILLSGLKSANCDLTAVVTVADDGGSSGKLRSALNTIPPGDLRNCLVALSDSNSLYKDVFQYRFAPEDQEFSGHAIGNLIIAALTEMRGSIYSALKLLSVTMAVKGRVLPACEEPLILQAHYQEGDMIEGETTIVEEKRPIQSVSVRLANQASPDQSVKAGRGVVDAIMGADMVVLGPGSLYTSILPNIVIPEIRQAIQETSATVVYICNIMTQLGETEGFSDADHLRVINDHLQGHYVDACLLNRTTVPYEYIENNEVLDYLVQVSHDRQALKDQGAEIIGWDFLNLKDSGVYHDKDKLVQALIQVYRDHHQH